MAALGLTGGDKLQAYLETIARNVAPTSGQPSVRVGFLENSFYPADEGGMPTAQIAAQNEWGGTISHPAGQVTVYRKLNAAGTEFLRGGRFVKRRVSNFASTHARKAYTTTQPPRPFFRNMIAKYSPAWGGDIAVILLLVKYDILKALRKMGQRIEGQLRQSIVDLTSPPLSPRTIAEKSRGRVKKIAGVLGPAKPLIWTGHMLNSVDSEVTT